MDETIGPENWQCDYRSIDGKLFCGVGMRFKYGEWVWKWDTGTPSNMEAQKGEASDAFKRACFKWGLGRELYTAPEITVFGDKCSIKQGRNGNWQCYDDFRVTELEVDGGQIVKLTVCNMSRKGQVVYGSVPKLREQQAKSDLELAYERMGKAVEDWCVRHNHGSEEEIKKTKEGIRKRPEWPGRCRSLDYIESIIREFSDV